MTSMTTSMLSMMSSLTTTTALEEISSMEVTTMVLITHSSIIPQVTQCIILMLANLTVSQWVINHSVTGRDLISGDIKVSGSTTHKAVLKDTLWDIKVSGNTTHSNIHTIEWVTKMAMVCSNILRDILEHIPELILELTQCDASSLARIRIVASQLRLMHLNYPNAQSTRTGKATRRAKKSTSPRLIPLSILLCLVPGHSLLHQPRKARSSPSTSRLTSEMTCPTSEITSTTWRFPTSRST